MIFLAVEIRETVEGPSVVVTTQCEENEMVRIMPKNHRQKKKMLQYSWCKDGRVCTEIKLSCRLFQICGTAAKRSLPMTVNRQHHQTITASRAEKHLADQAQGRHGEVVCSGCNLIHQHSYLCIVWNV